MRYFGHFAWVWSSFGHNSLFFSDFGTFRGFWPNLLWHFRPIPSSDWAGPGPMRCLLILAAALCSQLYMLNHVVVSLSSPPPDQFHMIPPIFLLCPSLFLQTTELFPTAIRNTAASFVQIANRTGWPFFGSFSLISFFFFIFSFPPPPPLSGVVLSPHLFYLAFLWPPLPFLLMFLLLSLNLLLYLCFIPETKGKPLADHMPEKTKNWKKRAENEWELNNQGKDDEEKGQIGEGKR